MTAIALYLDTATEARLRQAAEDLGRSVEDLAGCAVSEMALDYFRHSPADPGRVIVCAGARLNDRDQEGSLGR